MKQALRDVSKFFLSFFTFKRYESFHRTCFFFFFSAKPNHDRSIKSWYTSSRVSTASFFFAGSSDCGSFIYWTKQRTYLWDASRMQYRTKASRTIMLSYVLIKVLTTRKVNIAQSELLLTREQQLYSCMQVKVNERHQPNLPQQRIETSALYSFEIWGRHGDKNKTKLSEIIKKSFVSTIAVELQIKEMFAKMHQNRLLMRINWWRAEHMVDDVAALISIMQWRWNIK